MAAQDQDQTGECRRDFLKQVGAASATLVAAQAASGAAAAPAEEPKLPQIRIGPHAFSRLIVGSNCFGAGSHLSVFVNHEMRAYYTEEQILKTLRRCQEVGITCWQSGGDRYKLWRQLLDEGGKMRYIAIESGNPDFIQTLKEAGCVGIAHHGEATDSLFKQGKLDTIHDYLKRIRDAGLLVGVSTHMPAVVDAAESKGWDLDYYMTCVYERHRGAAELEKLLGHVPIPVGEVYLTSDPPRMFKAMRATKRPCLAFKILAAGRLSDRKEWVEGAFRDTFASIKPNDAVIVGIYDRYSDQPAECAALVKRFGSAPLASPR
jgi:hypothetical protein